MILCWTVLPANKSRPVMSAGDPPLLEAGRGPANEGSKRSALALGRVHTWPRRPEELPHSTPYGALGSADVPVLGFPGEF